MDGMIDAALEDVALILAILANGDRKIQDQRLSYRGDWREQGSSRAKKHPQKFRRSKSAFTKQVLDLYRVGRYRSDWLILVHRRCAPMNGRELSRTSRSWRCAPSNSPFERTPLTAFAAAPAWGFQAGKPAFPPTRGGRSTRARWALQKEDS